MARRCAHAQRVFYLCRWQGSCGDALLRCCKAVRRNDDDDDETETAHSGARTREQQQQHAAVCGCDDDISTGARAQAATAPRSLLVCMAIGKVVAAAR